MRRFLMIAALLAIGATVHAREPLFPRLRATLGTVVRPATSTSQGMHEQVRGLTGVSGYENGSTYEGVGFSTASPDDALAHCCYSNSGMPVVNQRVVQANGGWYAIKQYAATQPVRTAVANSFEAVGQTVIQAGQLFRPVCSNGVCQ